MMETRIYLRTNLSKRIGIHIYQTLITPTPTYAMETTTMAKKEETELKATERKIERFLLNLRVTPKAEKIKEVLESEIPVKYIRVQKLN